MHWGVSPGALLAQGNGGMSMCFHAVFFISVMIFDAKMWVYKLILGANGNKVLFVEIVPLWIVLNREKIILLFFNHLEYHSEGFR